MRLEIIGKPHIVNIINCDLVLGIDFIAKNFPTTTPKIITEIVRFFSSPIILTYGHPSKIDHSNNLPPIIANGNSPAIEKFMAQSLSALQIFKEDRINLKTTKTIKRTVYAAVSAVAK